MSNPFNSQLQQIAGLLKGARNILVASHEIPDSDAVGSVLALRLALSKLGFRSVCYLPDLPSPALNFLPDFFEIKNQYDENDIDLIFCLDYGDFQRLRLPSSFTQKKMITIDHHQGDQYGEVKVIEPEFSSTSEIIYYLLKGLEIDIDKSIATCLLTGIVSDTGFFSHISTSSRTLKAVSDLLVKGAPLRNIIDQIINLKLQLYFGGSATKIWGRALSRVSFDQQKGLAYSYLTHYDLKDCPNFLLDSAGISSAISTIYPADLGLFLLEYEKGKVRGSLRSEPSRGKRVDSIAKSLGGGGHPFAAGFRQEGTVEEVLKKVIDLIG